MMRHPGAQVAVVVFLAVASSCSSGSYRVILSEREDGFVEPLKYHFVGDTLRLVAHELIQEFLGAEEGGSSSKTQPSRYTWRTDNPAIVEMISPGVFVMRATGTTYVNARTDKAGGSATLTVCEQASVLRMTPREPVANLGETITLSSTVGAVGGPVCFEPQNILLDKVVPAGSPAELPLLSLISGQRYTGSRSGVAGHAGKVSVGKRTLRDTIMVTVR